MAKCGVNAGAPAVAGRVARKERMGGWRKGKIVQPFLPHPMIRFAVLFGCLSFWSPGVWADPVEVDGEVRAGHSHEGEAFNEGPRQFATRIAGCGNVHFPIRSSWPEAQAWFNQGVGQLHGFWYFEAERTFRHIAAQDPECAMAYWGMSMANWENPKRAAGFIEKAMEHREQADEAGRMWIDAQNAYLRGPEKDDLARRRQLIRDLEAIIHARPDDIEAKAFLANRIWYLGRMGIPITMHEPVDAMLREVLAKSPLHPAHHYRIHLWDEQKAVRALDSAAVLAATSPAIAHMWHMPGHIYSRLHRYDDSAWCQQASARVDHQHMLKYRVLPDQIHNYVHNQEWLIRNHQILGDARSAISVAKGLLANPRHPVLNTPTNRKASVTFGRMRLMETLEFYELWDEVLALAETGYLDEGGGDEDRLKRQRLIGLARFGKGETEKLAEMVGETGRQLAIVEDARSTAEKIARAQAEEEGKDRKSTDQAVANAVKPFGDQVRRMKEVHAELAAHAAILERGEADFGAIRRSKAALALLHLRAGDQEKALQLSKEAVDAAPKQALPLAARVEVLHACGRSDEAREVFGMLKEISAAVDLSAPVFQRVSVIAAGFGESADWRMPAQVREDAGLRPDLDTLGPQDWTPPLAPEFSLPVADESRVSLGQFKGRPVVVMFYLGHGCLHCIDQLNAFAPKRTAYLDAGIEMVAVSCDEVGDLRKSQDAYSEEGLFPFPILADPAMEVFRAYRAFDDFEGKPLHGTFLIDGAGRVLWQDIGAEPFGDPDFLLKEARRLLEIHRPES